MTTALLDYGIAATWNDNNEYELWDAAARIAHGFGVTLSRSRRAAAPAAADGPRLARGAGRARARMSGRIVVIAVGHGGAPPLCRRRGRATTGPTGRRLRHNLKMGLGLALSGVSNSGHDVGGFAGPAPDAELLVRWVQAGVLMPRFSIHSWNDDGSVNEPWMHAAAVPAITAADGGCGRRWCRSSSTCSTAITPRIEPIDPPAVARSSGRSRKRGIDGDDHLLGRDLLVALVVDPGAATTPRLYARRGRDDMDRRVDRRGAGAAGSRSRSPPRSTVRRCCSPGRARGCSSI